MVFGGLNGQFMIEEIERGARGMMPGSDMIGLFVDIWNRLEAGDRTGAWQVFTRALPLMRFELQPGMGVSAMKHNLAAAGVIRSAGYGIPPPRWTKTACVSSRFCANGSRSRTGAGKR